MAVDTNEINERIACACGWVEEEYDGGFAGPNCFGWHHPLFGNKIGLPDYMNDPKAIPELWELCRSKGWAWEWVREYSDKVRCEITDGFYSSAYGSDPQATFAEALSAALVTEEREKRKHEGVE